MKKISLIGIAVLFSLIVTAQRPYPTLLDLARFSKTTTCVVLEDNDFSFFNPEIKDAVKKYWKVTPYKFITTAEFSEISTDSTLSFLVLTMTNFSNDKSGTSFDYLNLLLGAEVTNIDMLPEFCTIPLSFSGSDDVEYSYKFGLVVRFIQQHAANLIKEPNNKALKYLKYYQKNIPLIKDKTILIRQVDLDPALNNEEILKEYYPYPIKIVDEEVIMNAIETKEPGVLIFHKVGPPPEKKSGTCIKMLIGTDDAVMYYYDTHMVDSKYPNGILISDLKRIAR